MLTKERTSNFRKLKLAALAIALIAVMVFCLVSCGSATPTKIEYVTGSAAKTEYNQGEVFDCTGAQIKVTYDNGAVETKDVTTEMVGNAPLTLNNTTVSVTYSENGATVVGYIAVTVVDPYAEEKAEAIAGLRNDATVKANSTDNGVDLLIRNYTADINAAATEADIAALVQKFGTELASYLAEKEDLLEQLEAVDMSKLYAQFKLDAESQKVASISGIKEASTIAAAKAHLESFKAVVANKLQEQKVYEGSGSDNKYEDGMIGEKINILKEINYYKAKAEHYKALIYEAHYNTNPQEMDAPTYNTENSKYNQALASLEWWYEYVTLAINLAGVSDDIKAEIVPLLETPIDKIGERLDDGLIVTPAPYKFDEATGAWVLDYANDEIYKLFNPTNGELQDYYDEAVQKYGETMTNKLMTTYGRYNDINLQALAMEIMQRYMELTDVQESATLDDSVNGAWDVIGLIDAIEGATDTKAALDAAWDALTAWADEYGIFSEDDRVLIINDKLTYGTVEANFAVKADDGVWSYVDAEGNPDDDGWTDYSFDQAYVLKHFVPNLEDLFDATLDYEAEVMLKSITDIGDVIFSYVVKDANGRGSLERIALAEENRVAYATNFEDEYKARFYDNGKDTLKATIDTASAKYTALVEEAEAVNELINDLPTPADIVISDYGSEGALRTAYEAYCTFASHNVDSNGTKHTDVIADVNNAGTLNNEAKLLDCMDVYTDKAFTEWKHVQATLVIYRALDDRLNLKATDENYVSADETEFRTALTDYAKKAVAEIEATVYQTTGLTDKDGMPLNRDKFNYDTVYDANQRLVNVAINAVADEFEDITYAEVQAKLNP